MYHNQCSHWRGVLGVEPPTSPCRPPASGQNSTPGGRVSTPHLSFAEVGMLLDSQFLLMQFLKYLGLHHDDLNVTTVAKCATKAFGCHRPELDSSYWKSLGVT